MTIKKHNNEKYRDLYGEEIMDLLKKTKLGKKLERRLQKTKAEKKNEYKLYVDENGENWGVATIPLNWK